MASINSTAPSLRDYLLSRNLILANSITDNGLSSYSNRLGTPANISTGNESITDQPNVNDLSDSYRDLNLVNNSYRTANNLEIQIDNFTSNASTSNAYEYSLTRNSQLLDNSLAYRELNTTTNLYLDASKQTVIDINQNAVQATSRMTNYLDMTNSINVAGLDTSTVNVLGSIINGRGVGIGSNGRLEPNFDIRGSIVGRVLGAVGAIKDTPLGVIAGRELAFAVANNALFNLQEKVELNPINLIKGASFIRESFKITIPLKNRVLANIGETVLGYRKPSSYLEEEADIFNLSLNSHGRNQAMIKNTGKGLRNIIFNNLNGALYQPGYVVDDGKGKKETTKKPNIYLGDIGKGEFSNKSETDLIANSSINLSKFTDEFDTLNNPSAVDSGYDFTWGGINNGESASLFIKQDSMFKNDKSLLSKTKKIFGTDRMKTITSGLFINEKSNQVNSTVKGPKGDDVMSKGSAVVSFKEGFIRETDPQRIFCRTWSTFKRYDSIRDLQKGRGLINYTANRRNIDKSVLMDNGMPKIVPYESDAISDNPKKFMFSLENLAWAGDSSIDLPECEKGNGDLTTGTKGRIMWFPPYGLDFTDNTSVNWDSTNFIGRGEPVYTYNNTERTGTLSFKVIADYASYNNKLINENLPDEVYTSIVAGCSDYDESVTNRLTLSEINQINLKNNIKPEEIISDKESTYPAVKIFFPNDSVIINPEYENGDGVGLGTTFGDGYTSVKGKTFEDTTDEGYNKPFFGEGGDAEKLKAYLRDECPACLVKIVGFASTQGNVKSNQRLSDDRASAIKKYFLDNIIEQNDPIRDKRIVSSIGAGEAEGEFTSEDRVDNPLVKAARYVQVSFEYDPNLDTTLKDLNPPPETNIDNSELNNRTKGRFIDECMYFEKMEQETPFIYNSLREKFKYFHPAFHSVTPEGLNSRLTFLQQCTRQGPTIINKKEETNTEKTSDISQPNNLAFGRPPVCILRVGDFYHTKIIIDNLNFTFDELQWDLNPEGIGVQPMIVNVDISFKFIGGSSLSGPINKLQNAISFNYFANTEIYDTRSDTLRPKTKEELVANPYGTHTIENGMSTKKINEILDKEYANQEAKNNKINNTPITNSNTNINPTSNNTTITDGGIISNFKITDYTYVFGDDKIVFHYILKVDKYKLNKEDKCKITIRSSDGLSQAVINVGEITLKPDSEDSIILNHGGGDVVLNSHDYIGVFGILLTDEMTKELPETIRFLNSEKGGYFNFNWVGNKKTSQFNIFNSADDEKIISSIHLSDYMPFEDKLDLFFKLDFSNNKITSVGLKDKVIGKLMLKYVGLDGEKIDYFVANLTARENTDQTFILENDNINNDVIVSKDDKNTFLYFYPIDEEEYLENMTNIVNKVIANKQKSAVIKIFWSTGASTSVDIKPILP